MRIRRLSAIAALALVAIALLGYGYERVAQASDAQRYPRPGRSVSIGGYGLDLLCSGAGSPTIILEAGLGESALGWNQVQRSLAGTARVCSYDRAGMAWSDNYRRPRTATNVADELHALLTASGEPGPYVLVGHSIGGLFVLRYAAAYPRDVAGVVLVDPTDPRSVRAAGYPWPAIIQGRIQGILAELGVVRLFGRTLVPSAVGASPPSEVLDAVPIVYGPQSQAAAVAELDASITSADEVLADEATGYLTSLPMVVISAADDSKDARTANERLAGLSVRGRHLVAGKGGHYVHYDDPQFVAEAVRTLVAMTRI